MTDFEKMSDKKLKEWLRLWEEMPKVRNLNDLNTYIEALQESAKRFNDESYWKIEYFREHPNNDIHDFYVWFKEI
jgi:hypothetical protein